MSLSGRGQGHVSNFYIVDWENFATASRRYTGDIYTTRPSSVCLWHQWDNGSRLGRVMVECTLSITHCLRLNLQLHTIVLVRTCRISSCCTVAWQLARFQLTRRIAWSLCDSWASCFEMLHTKCSVLMASVARSCVLFQHSCCCCYTDADAWLFLCVFLLEITVYLH